MGCAERYLSARARGELRSAARPIGGIMVRAQSDCAAGSGTGRRSAGGKRSSIRWVRLAGCAERALTGS